MGILMTLACDRCSKQEPVDVKDIGCHKVKGNLDIEYPRRWKLLCSSCWDEYLVGEEIIAECRSKQKHLFYDKYK